MPYEKYKRFWAVTDAAGRLICLTVYRKGAEEVLRRLSPAASEETGKKTRRPAKITRRTRQKGRGERA